MTTPAFDSRAADLLRDHLYPRGEDPDDHGVLSRGRLAWTPREPDHDHSLEPVEVARHRVLARRRLEAIEHRRRANFATVGSDCASVAS